MKKNLISILKLIGSLGLGILLIWLTFRGFSKPKHVVAPYLLNNESLEFISWNSQDENYFQVKDTIAFLSLINSETNISRKLAIVTDHEGVFSANNFIGNSKNLSSNEILGTIKLDIWQVLKETIGRANYWWLALGMILSVISHLSRAVRWKMLLKPLGYNPKFSNTFFAVMVMYLGNLAFPRVGEILRCSLLARYEKIPLEKSVGTMITERAVDVLMLLIVGLLTLATQYDIVIGYFNDHVLQKQDYITDKPTFFTIKNIILTTGVLVSIIALILFKTGKLPFADKIKKLVHGLWDGVKSVKDLDKPFWFVFHSFFIFFGYWAMIFACFPVIAETSNLGVLVGLSCLFFGALGMIAVQGGLGLYPFIISQILLLYGVSSSIGYAFGWIAWIGQTAMVILVGLLSLVLLVTLNKEPETKLEQ